MVPRCASTGLLKFLLHLSMMPGLIRNIQDRLLEESHPLRYFGTEVALPVELEVDRQSPVVVFFKLYNLRDKSADSRTEGQPPVDG